MPFVVENLELNKIAIQTELGSAELHETNLQLGDVLQVNLNAENIVINDFQLEKYPMPDHLSIEAKLEDDILTIVNSTIKAELLELNATGLIKIEEQVKFQDLKIRLRGPDDYVVKFLNLTKEQESHIESAIDLTLNVNGSVESHTVDISSKLNDLNTPYMVADRLEFQALYQNKTLRLIGLELFVGEGSAKVSQIENIPLSQAGFDKGIEDINITLNKLSTADVFKFLNGTLDPLIGDLSGDLRVDLSSKKLQIKTLDSLLLSDFELTLDNQTNILRHDNLKFNELQLSLDLKTLQLNLSTLLTADETRAKISATITKEGINARLRSSDFVFNNFHEIAGVEIRGEGDLDVEVRGAWENVVFTFLGDIENAFVADYNLGDVKFTGELPIKTAKLSFPEIEGRKGFTRYTGSVSFDLAAKSYPLKISFDASRATLLELKEIIKPIVPKQVYIQDNVQARFKTNGSLAIDFDGRPVEIDIDVNGDTLSVVGEYFDRFGASLKMKTGRMQLKNITLVRENIEGRGQLLWDTDSNYLEYEFLMSGMSINSFNAYRLLPFTLEGLLDIDLYGSGIIGSDHSSRGVIALRESTIKRTPVQDSKLDLYFTRGELTMQGALMEGIGRLEAFLPLASSKQALVRVDLTASTINPLIGLLAPARMLDGSLSGRIFAQAQASFPMNNFEKADIKLDLRDVRINYKKRSFILAQQAPLQVKKGAFDAWNISSTEESDLKLFLSAKGNLGGNFFLLNEYTVPAEFFELTNDRLLDMSGSLEGRASLEWKDDGLKSHLTHNARNFEFRIKDVPGRFSNLMLDAYYNDGEIIIQSLSGNYGRGKFNADGKLLIQFPYPSSSIRLNLSDISYPLFNRSNLNFDARLSLVGSRPPYLFSGQVGLQQVSLVEDVGTYLGKIGGESSYDRFIPNTTQNIVNQYLEMDIGVVSNNAIRVSNPLMDITLDTKLKMTGEVMSPTLSGRVSANSSRSKILFKGHEFTLSKATADFDPTTGPAKAAIDLIGKTTVSGYNIDLIVSGPAEKVNIALSSEPALPQDEIVSLLTLGITSDISRNLNEEDRRNITTMSLGGFLFDQLQLARGLDSNLGLKVSLAPEFSNDEGNLIEEASSDTSTSRRLRTGTKLKVQSQLGKKTSVSFSSTLGGEVEQKQEMNINYDMNRSWSIEGVYELKSSADENQGDTESLGADVKYRWSF